MSAWHTLIRRARAYARRAVVPGAARAISRAREQVAQALGQPVQTRLKLGAPDDAHEREADATADRVMRMPERAGNSPAEPIQRKCAECEEEEQVRRAAAPEEEEGKEEEEPVQRKGGADAGGPVAADVAARVQARRGGGQPLPAGERAFFEARFGADFSRVRIHADAEAASLSRGLSARAFTVGRDLFFAGGEYRPGTAEGRHLMAHELTHTLQQRGAQGNTVRRWQVGPAPAPAGWSVVTDAAHLRRLNEAEGIVRGVLPSRRCQNFFSSGCGTANALRDAFDNANVYLLPNDDNVFGARRRPGSNIAFNLRAFRIGRYMMASTLLHEMFHTCDPTVDQNTRELNSENAVETCRLHTPWIDSVSPRRGGAGTRVTIMGWGFGPIRGASDRVRIGGVNATVVSWAFTSDTSSRVRIVVQVPAGAGAGGVVVVNNNVSSNAASFTVV